MCCVVPANIVTESVFDALSIGSGLVVAVLLWLKRDVIYSGPLLISLEVVVLGLLCY